MHYFGCNLIYLDVDYRLYLTWIIHHKLWVYEVEDNLRLGVREHKGFNTTDYKSNLLSVLGSSLSLGFTSRKVGNRTYTVVFILGADS
jgi:hypothetical protein